MAGFAHGALRAAVQFLLTTAAACLATACSTGGSGSVPGATALAAPAGLRATAVSANRIDLAWSAAAAAAGYRIAYQTGASAPGDCSSGTVIDRSSAAATTYSVDQLRAGTTYSFVVCAVDSTRVSIASAASSATTPVGPPDPQNAQAAVVSSTEIDLSWTAGGAGTAGYQIAYAAGNAPADCFSGTVITGDTITGTARAVTGLTGGTLYGFRICAVDAAAITGVSNGAPVSAATYSLSQSTVTVASAHVAIGGTDAVQLAVKNGAGSALPLTGLNVAFSLTGGTSTGTFGAVTDNGDGTYGAVFTAGSTSGTPSQVIATINGETVTSAPPTLQVDAGPPNASTSSITVSPAGVLEGQTVAVTVTSRDADGNREYTGGATVALQVTGVGAGTSDGTLGAVSDLGNGLYTATFTATAAGTPITITGTLDGTAIGGTPPSITVSPCNVAQVIWTQDPNSSRTAGQTFTRGTVELHDGSGDVCGLGPVNFTLQSTGAPLNGTAAVTPTAGVATLYQSSIEKVGTYNIVASAGGVDSAPSAAVTIIASTPAKLGFTHLPAVWDTGAVNSVQVAVEDQYGNIAGTYSSGSVTLALGADPGGTTLSGTTAVPVSGSLATFNDLSLDTASTGYTLTADYHGYQGVSDTFDVADSPGVNLQVPIELADSAVANTAPVTTGSDVAYATETSFDPTAYDGSVQVYFEVVASNTSGQATDVGLDLNCAGPPVATVSVPDGATAQRVRSGALALAAGHYCIDVPQLATDAALVVHSARLIVSQTGAHITRVYVPLLSYAGVTGSIDSVTQSDSTFTQKHPGRYAIWRDEAAVTGVAVNGYTLEVLAQGTHAGNAYVALVDRSDDTPVVQLRSGLGGGIHFQSVSFDSMSAPQLTSSHDYELRVRGGSSSGNVYKGGLWIQLEDLTSVTTYWRTNREPEAGVTVQAFGEEARQQPTLADFSNPQLAFSCTAAMAAAGDSATLDLVDVAGDTGTASPQAVTNSAIAVSGATKALSIVTGLSGYNDGDDAMTRATVTSGTLDPTQCELQINATR